MTRSRTAQQSSASREVGQRIGGPSQHRESLLRDHTTASQRPPWAPSLSVAFKLILTVRVASAMWSGIADCDETYNYWEPLHLISYPPEPMGTSQTPFQTWEYSPEFAIRSWAYIVQYLPLASWLPRLLAMNKLYVFFVVRIGLAFVSSFCEASLYRAVVEVVNPRVGRYMLAMLISSAGMYEAATALLPSTYVMYTSTLALAFAFYPSRSTPVFASNSAMAYTPGHRVLASTSIFALGAFLGWPFALVLALPFVFEELFLRSGQLVSAKRLAAFRASRIAVWLRCVAKAALIAVPLFLVDTIAYGRPVMGTLNIFIYNVLSARRGAGPELYGVEPWHYYLQNLTLNFGPVVALALLSFPLLLLSLLCDSAKLASTAKVDEKKSSAKEQLQGSNSFTLLTLRLLPLYLWLALLTSQAHKEERFVFPAYPLICFNAAVALYLARGLVERAHLVTTNLSQKTSPSPVLSCFTLLTLLVSGVFSLLRVVHISQSFGAPFEVLNHLSTYELPRVVAAHFPSKLPPAARERVSRGLQPVASAREQREEHTGVWSQLGINFGQADRTQIDLASLRRLKSLDADESEGLRLCYAKEWYRFPTHFLVPDGIRVDFVRSEFKGILPKHFVAPTTERETKFGWAWPWRSSTRAIQTGFNDLNLEEEDRYVDINTCDYLVDVDYTHRFLTTSPPLLEPRYTLDSASWTRVHCVPFLDSVESRAHSGGFFGKARATIERTLWLPGFARLGTNKYGDYCLLRTTRENSHVTSGKAGAVE